jgi:hypothetical protein
LWKKLQSPGTAFVACWVVVVVALVTAFTIANGIVRPTMYSDSGWGFLGWDSRAGLPINMSASPDPADISKDVSGFMTAWSPGQHVLPGLLEGAGLSLGLAMVAVAGAAALTGLAGWFALYRAFGFPVPTCAIAVLIMACTRHVGLAFGIYNGGEILLFGVSPWFLLPRLANARLGGDRDPSARGRRHCHVLREAVRRRSCRGGDRCCRTAVGDLLVGQVGAAARCGSRHDYHPDRTGLLLRLVLARLERSRADCNGRFWRAMRLSPPATCLAEPRPSSLAATFTPSP